MNPTADSTPSPGPRPNPTASEPLPITGAVTATATVAGKVAGKAGDRRRNRPPPDPAEVARVVAATRKYAAIDADLIACVCRTESPKESRLDDAVKRAKRKLHQMVGAYLDADLPFDDWSAQLARAAAPDRPALCRGFLEGHASTRERLPELEGFFAAAFDGIRPPARVVDLACGLNPLARPFMPLPADTLYRAMDVHLGLVDFVQRTLTTLGYPAACGPWNLLGDQPPPAADVILLLKTLPCLEQADASITRRLLARLDAPLVVVTFPTVSLGGARRGMAGFYRDRFLPAVPTDRFTVESREFRTELMFRLHRRHGAPS